MPHLLMRYLPLAWIARRPAAPEPCQQLLGELPLRLLQQPDSHAPLLRLLEALVEQTPARHAWLLLPGSDGGHWQRLGEASAHDDCPHGMPLPNAQEPRFCDACTAGGRHRLICPMPLADGRCAVLLLEYPRPVSRLVQRQAWRVATRLAEVLRVLGAQQGQRHARTLDHGALARELHDSVAQQLGYLQIRARRLQAVLDDPQQAQTMAADLQDRIQCLHRQVRELLVTARLTMDGRSLRQALEASVEEFSRCSSCVFVLDNRLAAEQLPDSVAFEAVQIVREALTNVVRHSHARQVRIDLRELDGAGVQIRVSDDGQGIGEAPPGHGHFGLRIMHERAAAIGAQLSIGPGEAGGTLVQLRWRPA